MAQNINLLEELTVYPISAYNCNLMVRLTIAWALLLTLIYGIALGVYFHQKKSIVILEDTQKEALTKIVAYKQELAAFEPTYTGTSSFGFSSYLLDLAKFTPQGIWLKEIIISEIDGSVALKGSTIAASGISTLLNSLSKAPNLGKKKFNEVQLDKNTDSDSADFTISTIALSADKEQNKKP